MQGLLRKEIRQDTPLRELHGKGKDVMGPIGQDRGTSTWKYRQDHMDGGRERAHWHRRVRKP